MKKIIAAAAGLMIAGSAMVASAAVEFSGDARARYYYNDNVSLQGDLFDNDVDEDHWSNRVRLKMKGTTAGGSYAVMRIRANNGSWGDDSKDQGRADVVYDHAYVGTDFGCINAEAGRNDYGITTGFWNDANLDLLKLSYSMNDTTLVGTYSVTDNDRANGQSEDRLFTLGWMQGWGEWSTSAAVAVVNADYDEDDVFGSAGEDSTGAMAVIGAAGPIGPVALAFELGWQEDGYVATDEVAQGYEFTGDDGFGGYITAGMDFDALNVTLAAGFAIDGYVWDLPVGFTMLGGDKIVTPSVFSNLGTIDFDKTPLSALTGDPADTAEIQDVAADTYWAGIITAYQITEDLGLTFDLAYASVEPVDSDLDHDAFEVGSRLTYLVNDGTALKFEAGYLAVDGDLIDDDTFAGAVSLELSF